MPCSGRARAMAVPLSSSSRAGAPSPMRASTKPAIASSSALCSPLVQPSPWPRSSTRGVDRNRRKLLEPVHLGGAEIVGEDHPADQARRHDRRGDDMMRDAAEPGDAADPARVERASTEQRASARRRGSATPMTLPSMPTMNAVLRPSRDLRLSSADKAVPGSPVATAARKPKSRASSPAALLSSRVRSSSRRSKTVLLATSSSRTWRSEVVAMTT